MVRRAWRRPYFRGSQISVPDWRFRPDSGAERFVVAMACLLREASGVVTVAHDRLEMGLFPRAFWLESLAAAGFEAIVVPLEHSRADRPGEGRSLRPTFAAAVES